MKRFLFYACIACAILAFTGCENGASDEITIYGNVIDRTTGLPLYNVLIQEKNKVGGSTATGNDGNYEFKLPLNGNSEGRYYLIASKDKYSSSEYELDMGSVDKNRRVKVDFQLTKESIMYTGTVLDSQNKPIIDAQISATFFHDDNYNIGTTAITDANGIYTLELPRPHRYNDATRALLDQWQFKITVHKDGYADLTHTLNQNADDMGKTITLNFVMGTNQITITGKVTNSNGVALPKSYLTVYCYQNYYSSNYLGSTMTDSSGKYTILIAPKGSYTYYFNMENEGYSSVTKTLKLSSADIGKTYTLDFTLTK